MSETSIDMHDSRTDFDIDRTATGHTKIFAATGHGDHGTGGCLTPAHVRYSDGALTCDGGVLP
jgi:hypothetical protein